MKCPKCGSEMESWTEDSDFGKVAGMVAGASIGLLTANPIIGGTVGTFVGKRLGGMVGGKLFGDQHYYCPKCSQKQEQYGKEPDWLTIEYETKKIIGNITGIQTYKIRTNSKLEEDLGLDTAGFLRLVFAIQEKFQIEVGRYDSFETFGDLVKYIKTKKGHN